MNSRGAPPLLVCSKHYFLCSTGPERRYWKEESNHSNDVSSRPSLTHVTPKSRAVGRSENPGGRPVVIWWA